MSKGPRSGCILATCPGCGDFVWEAQNWVCDEIRGFRHEECGWDGETEGVERALRDLQTLRSAAAGKLGSKVDPGALDRMVERIRKELLS